MAIDPDVQVLLDELILEVNGLRGRIEALEAGSTNGTYEPVSYEVTLEDGSKRVFTRG